MDSIYKIKKQIEVLDEERKQRDENFTRLHDKLKASISPFKCSKFKNLQNQENTVKKYFEIQKRNIINQQSSSQKKTHIHQKKKEEKEIKCIRQKSIKKSKIEEVFNFAQNQQIQQYQQWNQNPEIQMIQNTIQSTQDKMSEKNQYRKNRINFSSEVFLDKYMNKRQKSILKRKNDQILPQEQKQEQKVSETNAKCINKMLQVKKAIEFKNALKFKTRPRLIDLVNDFKKQKNHSEKKGQKNFKDLIQDYNNKNVYNNKGKIKIQTLQDFQLLKKEYEQKGINILNEKRIQSSKFQNYDLGNIQSKYNSQRSFNWNHSSSQMYKSKSFKNLQGLLENFYEEDQQVDNFKKILDLFQSLNYDEFNVQKQENQILKYVTSIQYTSRQNKQPRMDIFDLENDNKSIDEDQSDVDIQNISLEKFENQKIINF